MNPRARRALLVALLALCAAQAPGGAAAQTPPSTGPSFSWVRLPGAEGCIAQTELAANVEARIGRPVFVRPAGALLLIEGRIGPGAGSGFEAVIAFSDPDGRLYGERALALDGSDCRALDDVVALVIAVTLRGSAQGGIALPPELSAQLEALFGDEPSTLDPRSLPPGPPAADARHEPRAEPARDRPVPVPEQTDGEREPPALRFGVDVGMAAASGLQPSGTLAPAARLHASYRDLALLAFAGGLAFAQRHEVEDPTQPELRGTLELRPWYLALSACALPGAVLGGVVELCARFGFGRLHAEASDFEADNAPQTQSWSELGPEVQLRAPLIGPLYARLGLGLPIRLSRPEFVYVNNDSEPETAFQVDRVGVYGELGFGINVP